MSRPLTLAELSTIISQHPEALAAVSQQTTITVDSIAYAISQMVIDDDVSRSVVALSTGTPRDEVRGGMLTMIQAAGISARTLGAHPAEKVAALFYDAVAPGFSSSTGTVQ